VSLTLMARLRTARAVLGLGRAPRTEPPAGPTDIPESIAIIMDGNGRWARERHLPVGAGHRAGARALKRVVRAASDAGVKDLTVFSFSTENWTRPGAEVDDLMELFTELIDREVAELHAERVRMRFIGRLDELNPGLQQRIAASEALTAENEGMNLFVAMNYGGRGEIVDAARRFAAECGPDAGEAEFAQFLYAPHMRDPQLIIRTSGEQRISNFLLWQGAYAELVFSPRLWPDFGPEDLELAMAEYGRRHRRFGGR